MPKCGRKCEVYSRVVGYHRPVKNWNDGKKEEFRERREYRLRNENRGQQQDRR
jgi:ribonucleoside-triphosphate reductase